MFNRRVAVAGLAVLAAASLAMSACESTGAAAPAGSSSPSAPASASNPTAALTAALASLKGTGFDFVETQGTATAGATGPGTYNPATQSASLTQKGIEQGISAEIDATQIGTQLWAKVDLGPLNAQLNVPNTWMKVDLSKITQGNTPFDFTGSDVFDIAGLLASVSNLQMPDASTITGNTDLSAATGDNTPGSDSLSKAGAKAKTTPFTIKLDGSGHVTSVVIDTSGYDPTMGFSWTFSNWGSPSAITAPTGDVTAAPDAAYQFFNQN